MCNEKVEEPSKELFGPVVKTTLTERAATIKSFNESFSNLDRKSSGYCLGKARVPSMAAARAHTDLRGHTLPNHKGHTSPNNQFTKGDNGIRSPSQPQRTNPMGHTEFFSSLMGSINKQSLDTPINSRLQAGIHFYATIEPSSSSEQPGCKKKRFDGRGVCKPPLQRSCKLVEPTPGFYSPIFLVLKQDKGWHPVINFKRLNQYLRVEHFKIETLRGFLQKNDLMIKVDMKDAYLTVPID